MRFEYRKFDCTLGFMTFRVNWCQFHFKYFDDEGIFSEYSFLSFYRNRRQLHTSRTSYLPINRRVVHRNEIVSRNCLCINSSSEQVPLSPMVWTIFKYAKGHTYTEQKEQKSSFMYKNETLKNNGQILCCQSCVKNSWRPINVVQFLAWSFRFLQIKLYYYIFIRANVYKFRL